MFAQISLSNLVSTGSCYLLLLNKLPKPIMTEDHDFAPFSESQKSGQDSRSSLSVFLIVLLWGGGAMGAGCTLRGSSMRLAVGWEPAGTANQEPSWQGGHG